MMMDFTPGRHCLTTSLAATLLAACSKGSDGSYQVYIEGEYLYLAAPLAG